MGSRIPSYEYIHCTRSFLGGVLLLKCTTGKQPSTATNQALVYRELQVLWTLLKHHGKVHCLQTAPGEATVGKILVVGLLIVMVLYLLRELVGMRMRGMRVARPRK